jgi:anti-anti-sigma regulatory factor
LLKHVKQYKGRLILCCLHPMVRDCLASTKLNNILESAVDEDAALASV